MKLTSRELRKNPLSLSEMFVPTSDGGGGSKRLFPKKSCLRNHHNDRNDDHNNDNDEDINQEMNRTDSNETNGKLIDDTTGTTVETESSLSFSSSSSSSISSSPLQLLAPGGGGKERPTKKLQVSFERIEIREYPIILGDNPSPNDGGVPITIDWKPQRRGIFDIDFYENNLCPAFHRHGKQLCLSANIRAKLAILGGATITEIGETVLSITKIQKHRAQSSQKGPLELLREGFDRTLHPHRHHHGEKTLGTSARFTRVPNEAPKILSSWNTNGDRLLIMYTPKQ